MQYSSKMAGEDLLFSVCALVIAIIMKRRRKQRRKRKIWTRDWVRNRQKYGAYHQLLQELRISDSTSYRNFLRMDIATFEELLQVTAPAITYQDTNKREAIPPGERLAVTLRFLATGKRIQCHALSNNYVKYSSAIVGGTYTSLQYVYRIPAQTIGKIVPETCAAITEALREYLKVHDCMSANFLSHDH